ncbi:MAG: 7-cyano-7-deazaguanine synthase [Candidatus Aureabacteria bacterium]|nr:7-cyano-7-deazaguanine synthase [Candidatus Auribacterota bacterium]
MKRAKTIAILFSGGTDSTATAVYYLQKGYAAHLLTFDNGAEKWLELAEFKAHLITKQFPGRCVWKLLDSTLLFHDLAIVPLVDDVKKYGGRGNLVCCGCKLAMLCGAIIYCRRHGIAQLADGFQKAQDYYPEQTPDYMIPADRFARAYGIRCLHPFWEHPDLSQDHITLSGAVPPSPIQPYCIFGCNPITDRKFIRPYVESKLPAMRQYLTRGLKSKA